MTKVKTLDELKLATNHASATRRGISCISCRSHTGKVHCGRLLLPRAQVSALPPARDQSDTAVRAAGAAAGVPFHGQNRANSVAEPRWHAPQRWLRPQLRLAAVGAVAPDAAVAVPAAARPAESECGRDNRSFRCRCAPPCLPKIQRLPS